MPEVRVIVSASDARSTADELLRVEVAKPLDLPSAAAGVRVGRSCRHCGSTEHGAPLVTGGPVRPHVSISRAPGVTLVAVCDAGPVGVDAEPADAGSFDGFDQVALHPGEHVESGRCRTRLWVRKEALLKATAEGLRTDPRRVRVDTDRVLLAGGETAWLQDLDLGAAAGAGALVAAVAVICPERPAVSVRAARAAAAGPATR